MNSVLLRVGPSHEEHLLVLAPVLLDVGVLGDDQVNNIKRHQQVAEVVEYFIIDKFLEGCSIDFLFRVEQPRHLVDDIFTQIDNPADHLGKLSKDNQTAAHLQFHLACSVLFHLKDEACLTEQDQRIEEARLYFMFKILRLNLEVTKNRHNFRNGQLRIDLNEIEQAGHVLLQVHFDLQRLEHGPVLLPDIEQRLVGDVLEVRDLQQERVHVRYRALE